jgi:hypothetical protein
MILANRPDVVIKIQKDRICLLIDVAMPSDRNVIKTDSKMKLKYKNISVRIQRMWNMKCFVILVTIGATGIVCIKHMWKQYLYKKPYWENGTSRGKCYNLRLEA